MSLSATIAALAVEAEGQMLELSASQRRMLQVLKDAPLYLARGSLAQWDADYHQAMSGNDDEPSENFRVIESIFEIAAVNLYGAFQAGETKRVYDSVVSELAKLGIRVSPNLPVAAW